MPRVARTVWQTALFLLGLPPTPGCSLAEHCQFLLMLRSFVVLRLSGSRLICRSPGFSLSSLPEGGSFHLPSIYFKASPFFLRNCCPMDILLFRFPFPHLYWCLSSLEKRANTRTVNMLEENTSSWNQRWLLSCDMKPTEETHQEKDKFRKEIFF